MPAAPSLVAGACAPEETLGELLEALVAFRACVGEDDPDRRHELGRAEDVAGRLLRAGRVPLVRARDEGARGRERERGIVPLGQRVPVLGKRFARCVFVGERARHAFIVTRADLFAVRYDTMPLSGSGALGPGRRGARPPHQRTVRRSGPSPFPVTQPGYAGWLRARPRLFAFRRRFRAGFADPPVRLRPRSLSAPRDSPRRGCAPRWPTWSRPAGTRSRTSSSPWGCTDRSRGRRPRAGSRGSPRARRGTSSSRNRCTTSTR